MQKAAGEIGGDIVKVIPRSPDVQRAENEGKTVIEALPDCDMAKEYLDLASKVMEVCGHESLRML